VSEPGPTLVALRALGLGDLLAAVPALRALTDAFPDHRRLLAAPAVLAPLTDLVGGWTVVPAAPLAPLARELRRPDVAVNLHGRGPQSHRVLLDLAPGRLVAFANLAVPETIGFPEWRPAEHERARWCRMLEGHGVPADASRVALPPPAGTVVEEARTVLHPGAASAARRWPVERWAEVARAEVARGRVPVLTGGSEELDLVLDIARRAGLGPEAVWAARTDLRQLSALVAGAGRVVCGDTGVAHLATAFGRPSVVLFGPTPPAEWGPPVEDGRHRVLWAGLTGDPHGRTPDPGLLAIEVADVLEALAALDELPGPRPTRPGVATT
jgi:ADP-heptose:LPS heptosyltransferase